MLAVWRSNAIKIESGVNFYPYCNGSEIRVVPERIALRPNDFSTFCCVRWNIKYWVVMAFRIHDHDFHDGVSDFQLFAVFGDAFLQTISESLFKAKRA